MPQFAPLSSARHAKLKLRNTVNTQRLEGQQMLPLVVHEFAQAGCAFPIVFIKNPDSEEYQCVALLALPRGQNLFLRDGKWTAHYLPGIVQTDPFRLMPAQSGGDDMVVAIDEESPLLSETDGEALFTEEGKLSELMERRKGSLSLYYEHLQVTRVFLAKLVELELLEQRELSITSADQQFGISGVYLISSEKLAQLPDETVLSLHRNGYLQAMHAQIMSVHQLRNLGALHAQTIAASS